MNNIEEYVKYIKRNRTHYKSLEADMSEAIHGLAAETGEVMGVIQKAVRKGENPNYKDLLSELGDVLYYLLTVSYHAGFTIDDLMHYNESKLRSRGWGK
jgi:NTP pyrophosphatase (non-canonical NTP hydrolase)